MWHCIDQLRRLCVPSAESVLEPVGDMGSHAARHLSDKVTQRPHREE